MAETVDEEDTSDENPPCKRLAIEENRFDIFAKIVAAKLRGLPKEQAILAEKIINEVLFQAEIGSLTRSHKVTCEQTSQPMHVSDLGNSNFVSVSPVPMHQEVITPDFCSTNAMPLHHVKQEVITSHSSPTNKKPFQEVITPDSSTTTTMPLHQVKQEIITPDTCTLSSQQVNPKTCTAIVSTTTIQNMEQHTAAPVPLYHYGTISQVPYLVSAMSLHQMGQTITPVPYIVNTVPVPQIKREMGTPEQENTSEGTSSPSSILPI